MDSNTGKLYDSPEAAQAAGVALRDLVALHGSPEAVQRVSKAVKADLKRRNKKRSKTAKASRKKNR